MVRSVLPRTLVGSLLLVSPLLVMTAGAEAAGCTVVGTTGNDRLVGTNRADVICGFGGRDELVGRGGNDVFRDGPGNDTVLGGAGNDLFAGQPGRDTYSGGDGVDRMFYLDYTAGVVVDLDGVADDGVRGEQDNVQPDVENVTGTERADLLIGSADRNRLDGTWGDDVVRGGDGDDTLLGGSDFDSLYGEGGDDTLDGGTYNDVLVGGAGADVMDGRGTMSPYANVCDLDPGDVSVLRCVRDDDPPVPVVPSNTQQLVEPGQRLRYTLHAEDVAGTARVEVRLTRESDGVALDVCPGAMTRLMQDPWMTESDWRWVCDIPADAALGGYVLESRVVDRLGNVADYGSEVALPARVDVAVVSSEPDTTAPTVSDASVSPSGPLLPGDEFTVTARIQDQSGVDGATVSVERPNLASAQGVCDPGVKTSGHLVDGTWTFACRVPLATMSGPHKIRIRTADRLWNSSQYPEPVVATYEVEGGDDAGPDLVSLTADPSTVAPGQSFDVYAVVTDASGVQEQDLSVQVYGTMSGSSGFFCQDRTLLSGTTRDGTWRLACTMPAGSPEGEWLIMGHARDVLGTYTNVSAEGTWDDTRGTVTVTAP